MINSLKKFFQQTEIIENQTSEDLYLLCGLMIEAANVDGNLDNNEINKISESLITIFEEDPILVKLQLEKCLDEVDNNKSLHSFTSKINKTFSESKKTVLLEVLWEIILEDGKIHDFESNLIRRLAGLLYISDIICGQAKKKAMKKIDINKKVLE